MRSPLAKAMALVATVLAFAVPSTTAEAEDQTVRLAVVNTPHYSGLIEHLLDEFQARTGLAVEVYSGSDVYERARDGEADIVISHFGKDELQAFVLDGYGGWPTPVFSNQAVLIGPPSDPAGVRGMRNAADALLRIAEAEAPFVVNDIPGMRYLTEILWRAAGGPDRGEWMVDEGVARGRAVGRAEELGGYVLFGAYPFLRFRDRSGSAMEIMVAEDPILQRMMVAVLVDPDAVEGVNADGAAQLRDHLLEPETQAEIAAFRSHGVALQLWWPAGRHN